MNRKVPNSKLTAIDLFAGCGGLTQGLRDAGFAVVGAVELDPKAAATYRLNHNSTRLVSGDIRVVDPLAMLKSLGLEVGELSLLAGCPPCQGFSRLRTKNGASSNKDQRNGLISEFSRFVEATMPKTIMLENVPQLGTTGEFRDFVANLCRLGYFESSRVLDVADYSVPQRRKRLILIASRLGSVAMAEPTSPISTVRQFIGGLPMVGHSGDAIHDLAEKRSDKVKAILAALPKDGGSRSDLPRSMLLNCHKKSNGFRDVYGRMRWDAVAPTITSGCTNPSKGRFVHPEDNRAISLREAAILQGFPKDYKFDATHGREAISLMIGNALPPPFIRSHATKIKLHLAQQESERKIICGRPFDLS